LKLRQATLASRDAQQAVRARELSQLRETLARLNESIASAKASLDGLTIRAPTDGQLTALDAEVGQSKAQGAVLGQVDSLESFKITAQVDEFYLGRVTLGQLARFTLDDHNYAARVTKIYPQVMNGSFKVDLHRDLKAMALDTIVGVAMGGVPVNYFHLFDYADGKRVGLWPGLAEAFPATGDPAAIELTELSERMLFVEALESVRCLDEGVLNTAADANIGSILGIGFPPWTGGVLQYINGYPGGPAGFVARADALAARHGERFAVPDSLRKRAESAEPY